MKTVHGIYSVFFILLFATSLAAQQNAGSEHKTSIFETLTAMEGTSLTLETDFITLRENRKSEDRFPGVLTSADGTTYPVDLKTRGMFRRKMGELPPLKIKFSKKGLSAAGLDTMNEIKLVIPLTLDKKGDDLIIREYIAYRMWEQLSPYSIRARLVQLTLKDAHTGTQQQMFSIVLEDKEEFLSRVNGTLIESYGVAQDQFDGAQLALMGMFQYMIGNTDWDLGTYRNLRLVRIATQGQILAIPYDFDFSGLVNAPYASPSYESGKDSVRQRFFMVNGLSEADLNAATKKFLDARADLTAWCNSPFLTRRPANSLSKYLDSFYEKIPACSDIQCAKEKAPEGIGSASRD